MQHFLTGIKQKTNTERDLNLKNPLNEGNTTEHYTGYCFTIVNIFKSQSCCLRMMLNTIQLEKTSLA